MTQPAEHIEKLISRSLDGELSDDEQLELDRTLIRSPEARRLFEDHQRIDAIASEVLQSILPPGQATILPDTPTAPPHTLGRRRKAWWILPTAVAACLAAMLLLNPWGWQEIFSPKAPVVDASPDDNTGSATPLVADRNRPLRPVRRWHQPRFTDRRLDRDWIGVQGADGNIHWIQINRATTIERPGAGAKIKLVNSDL